VITTVRGNTGTKWQVYCRVHLNPKLPIECWIQLMQDNNLTNIHNLGLVPANYVPDASKLDADSWTGALPG